MALCAPFVFWFEYGACIDILYNMKINWETQTTNLVTNILYNITTVLM